MLNKIITSGLVNSYRKSAVLPKTVDEGIQKSLILAALKPRNNGALYAVCSSSPEEDLSGASFAGGYETILGVNESGIFDAVKKAFISCMNERVFFYKFQNGFDT